jgi:hypothetical protein
MIMKSWFTVVSKGRVPACGTASHLSSCAGWNPIELAVARGVVGAIRKSEVILR